MMPRQQLSRRTFLRASGVSIALPLLDVMQPRLSRASDDPNTISPKRMVLIGRPLGLHAPFFFPESSGKEYAPSRYLKLLEPLRNDFTVFSGMSHLYGGGHGTRPGLMTGAAPENMRPGNIRNTISLDQDVSARIQSPTRFASLTLGSSGLSWNRKGMLVPSENRATRVFKKLFITGTPAEIANEVERIENGRSILDGVRDQARSLSLKLGAADRDRIELLMTSIREAEQSLQQDEQWVRKPKPHVSVKPFTSDHGGPDLIRRERQWYDLVHLALQTDSTRVISLSIYSHGPVVINGQQIGHHEASHHGRKESNIARLASIEEAQIQAFGDFLLKLKSGTETGESLLDRTQVLYAGDLGNASAHTTNNLPILLAGGGFKHAGHVTYDRKNNLPMSNLFVRMRQQIGIESDHFGSSTGMVNEV